MSLYQKYRSKSFSEVLTQHHVTDILQASIKNGSFGHAYLFVGTRGTGKTSLARIFARTLNCQKEEFVKEHGEPCNECQSCLLSLNGSHPDIIEMDAASNRGIDEVRNLKEGVDFLPSIGRYKVYIIDETHMMTKEAFNALLKTIEEPPKHILFIMCTTELFKVPPTIVSRSQVFELKHAGVDEIIAKIDLILNEERKEIDHEGKKLIAKLGKGSFRDTESILEKVIASSQNQGLKLEDVISILGLSSVLLVENTKKSLYDQDLKELQRILSEEIDEGGVTTFNYQVAESVYEDIVEDLDRNDSDGFKFELFDFLSSVDKDIRNTTNPKLVYVAKVLNFLKKTKDKEQRAENKEQRTENKEQRTESREQRTVEDPKSEILNSKNEEHGKITNEKVDAWETPPSKGGRGDVEGEENPSPTINPRNSSAKLPTLPSSPVNLTNPSAFLRQRKKLESATVNLNSTALVEDSVEKKPAKFISKIDFLDFIKEKNSFLYRFFLHREFQIEGEGLIINAEKKMEKDLLTKPQTQDLVKAFGTTQGINLKVIFGEPKIDMRKSEEKAVVENKKKVEDLGEEEIKEMFGIS